MVHKCFNALTLDIIRQGSIANTALSALDRIGNARRCTFQDHCTKIARKGAVEGDAATIE